MPNFEAPIIPEYFLGRFDKAFFFNSVFLAEITELPTAFHEYLTLFG